MSNSFRRIVNGGSYVIDDTQPFKVPDNKLLESATFTPTLDTAEYNPGDTENYPSGYDGVHKVIVNGIRNADPNLRSENIVKDVEIFGVIGSAETGGGSATIVPRTNVILNADTTRINKLDGTDGMDYTTFSLNPNLRGIIKDGEPLLGIVGNYTGGSVDMHQLYVQTPKPSTADSPSDPVTIQTGDLIITDDNLIPSNIKHGESIFGVEGTYTGDGSYDTAKLYVQTYPDPGIVENDLYIKDDYLIPGNIKSGVTIFGVTGNYGFGQYDIFNDGKWYSNFGYIDINYPSTSGSGYDCGIDYSNGSFYITKDSSQTYIRAAYAMPKGSLSKPSGKTSIRITVSQLYTGAKFNFYVLSPDEDWLTHPSDCAILDSVGVHTYTIPPRYSSTFSICMNNDGGTVSAETGDRLISISHIEFI